MAATTSFSPAMFTFLRELADNNDREWFAENKARYESEVLGPCLDFIAAMARPLEGVAPRFTAIPKPSSPVVSIRRERLFRWTVATC